VTDPRDIGKAIREAIDANRPAVIDVVIDQAAVAPVAVMAGQGSRAGTPPASFDRKTDR